MTPESAHQFVSDYNWDDGLAPIIPIVDDAATDFATALMVFWRLEGPFFDSDAACNVDARELNARVRSRLVSGFYENANLHYDPVADNGLSRVQLHKLRGQGAESVLLDPV